MTERRQQPRTRKHQGKDVSIRHRDRFGATEIAPAKVIDDSNGGMGLETGTPLAVGSIVTVLDEIHGGQPVEAQARIVNCVERDHGRYRISMRFEDAARGNPFFKNEGQQHRPSESIPDSFIDFYEILQLSPNADPQTIHRVYRLMAQRFHPDNAESGDEEQFKLVLKAYRVLNDAEQRAAYDLQHRTARKVRWKIFDQPKAALGMHAEKSKRRGILSLLYTKRLHQHDQPSMTIMEMEELLGCAREHLEFSLWYLRENGWLVRGDNGRFFITAKGVDQFEEGGESWLREDRLLTSHTKSTDDVRRVWERMQDEAVATA